MPFFACVFGGYNDYTFEIARYWKDDFKNKFIISFYHWEDNYDKKKEIKKLINNLGLLNEFKEAKNMLYWNGWKRDYKTFLISEEESLIKYLEIVFQKLNKNKK